MSESILLWALFKGGTFMFCAGILVWIILGSEKEDTVSPEYLLSVWADRSKRGEL